MSTTVNIAVFQDGFVIRRFLPSDLIQQFALDADYLDHEPLASTMDGVVAGKPSAVTAIDNYYDVRNFATHAFSATFDEWPGTAALLERIFESGNVGALRSKLAYSMSVGDVVRLEIRELDWVATWACASEGWTRVV